MSSSSPALPFQVISNFAVGTPWGRITSALKRYEIATPRLPGTAPKFSDDVRLIHGERSSLIIRSGGGHLRAPVAELLEEMCSIGRDRLQALGDGPFDHLAGVVSWLEAEQREGLLQRSYTTAILLVAVDDTEIWSWHCGPHGLVRVVDDQVRFVSTDLRIPVLHALGAMPPRGYPAPEIDLVDKASSVFCIDTPLGYEKIRMCRAPAETVIALDRGALPFGPWPSDGVSLDDFWQLDAAWRHGELGRAVAIGNVTQDDLGLSAEWRILNVPFW